MTLLYAIWLAPATLPIWGLYLLPAWWLGLIEPTRQHPLAYEFRANPLRFRWWQRLWWGWAGHALPFAIVLNTDEEVCRQHELRHVQQWCWLGPLFPLVYLVCLVLTGYRNHPLEKDARRYARQQPH